MWVSDYERKWVRGLVREGGLVGLRGCVRVSEKMG